jgi:hypothetical protein
MLKSLCECESNHTGSIQHRHRSALLFFSHTSPTGFRSHRTTADERTWAGSASRLGQPRTHAHAQMHARAHALACARRPARKQLSRLTPAPHVPPRVTLASSSPQIRCKPAATGARALHCPSPPPPPAAPPGPAGPTPSSCVFASVIGVDRLGMLLACQWNGIVSATPGTRLAHPASPARS